MKELFSLGELYISDFVKEGEQPRGGKHELRLVMEEDTKAVRIATTAPLDAMFGKYFYRSGITDSMKNELKDIVDSIFRVFKFNDDDVFLDIASNDGTLLSFVPDRLTRIGIDPADDTYKEEAEKHANFIIQDYFSAEAVSKWMPNQKAKCITAIAMFYDLDKPDEFLQDINKVLDDNGLFVMQLSYSGLMIAQLAFDNILSEHVYYYTLSSLKAYLDRNNLTIIDCQLNDTNGGSMRLYIMKNHADFTKYGSQPHRDVCEFRRSSLLVFEKTRDINNPLHWKDFFLRINILKEKVVSFIKSRKGEGKSVWAYGASTKGNTLLQYFGLDHTLIDGIAERSPAKYGLRTVGTNIPIYSEDEMRKANPNFLLILPWHFISEFQEREKEYLAGGGKFIVPCPQFLVI